jgi:transcription-repair coupling factor (superfamily II helicase)
VFPIQKGDLLERELLETCLVDNGYSHVGLVEDRGEFSIRGDIVDFFPPASINPVRIEFFGDEVESIREFDSSSQKSAVQVDLVKVFPVREICLNDEQIASGVNAILEYGRQNQVDKSRLRELVERIEQLRNFSGIEWLAPFFYPQRQSLLDYLSEDFLVCLDETDLLQSKSKEFAELIETEYANSQDRDDIVPPPEEFYLTAEQFFHNPQIKQSVNLQSLKLSDEESKGVVHFDIKALPYLRSQFDILVKQSLSWGEQGQRVTIVAPTKGQVKRIHQVMEEYSMSLDVDLGYIDSGFHAPDLGMVFIPEQEIFGRTHKHRFRRKPKSQSFQRGFKDLKTGDYLVHVDYGVGRYQGTKELTTGVGGGEFMEIIYADDEKLYIPMDALGYIQKFVGAGETAPPLNKLGGVAWIKQKGKARAAIREMAEDLLKLYAARELATGNSYTANPVLMQEFADSFEYEETDDQLKAIDDLNEDLEGDKPMDRLICGDVGYGKTEVAMRAAFKVVLEKKQVAILVPTTILAQQHEITFRERFKNHPVTIESVSRFKTSKEQKHTLKKIKSGQVDILIGTHRLLSKDVEFADLGLIVIDEEQRFGVKHKEKLKKLRTKVDILTLTATPIPRTLHFSLMGVRDLSVIETPPSDRLAVKTFVRKFDEKIVREAIMRELDRGGQIFFVHNKVKSIHSVREMILKIVPTVRIGIAHGQMPEKQLEEVMRKFMDQEIDLLLCTSIVESGLDIPSANTMIINRADQFGLAQLYQLRGRVGRYRHQAYAYLLIPGALAISSDARQRISAIEEMSELGSGFQLAARDMEIRGVGNMLGHKQSGHISAIGFDLYSKMIEETIHELSGETIETIVDPEIDLMLKGVIPKNYIPDLNQRLEIYRRLQLINNLEDREALQAELKDRYGEVPEPAEKLLSLLDIRILCQKLHITSLRLKGGEAKLIIAPTTPISPAIIPQLVNDRIQLLTEFSVGIRMTQNKWRDNLTMIKDFLIQLTAELPPLEE